MLSYYTINKQQDFFYRNQSMTLPANFYIALFTSLCTQAGPGNEVTAVGYARTAIARNLTTFSGTQGAGSTAVSSGITGAVSNNTEIALGTPTVPWGTIKAIALMDATVNGNMLVFYNLPLAKVVNANEPAILPIGEFISILTSS